MRYRPDILTLYGQLFDDTAAMLTKEAGFFDWLGRVMAKPGTVKRMQQEASHLRGEVGRQAKAIEESAHTMGLMEADIAAARAAEQRAQQELAKRTKELGALGAEPGQLGRLKALAAGGALTGAAGLAAAPLAYGAAQRSAEQQRRRTRNLAFGAGAAAGLAAPQLVRGLGRIAQGVGQTGLYPELQGLSVGSGGGY